MNQDDSDFSLAKSDISGRTSSEEGLLQHWRALESALHDIRHNWTLWKLEHALTKGNRQDVAIIEEIMDGEIL